MQQRQEDFRLPLGTVGVHAKRGNSDFRATDVNSVDDLPVALFGAQLDRESFSQRADGWQATWRGEREGHVLELIWNTQTGWQLAFTWCGKQILAGAAPEVKRFSPLVQQTVQAFNEVVLSNPSHLNAIFFPTLPGMPEMVMLPDGVFQTLMMPLHAGRVVDAALRFAAFADLKLQGLASATIVRRAFELHGSDGASAQPEARQAIVAASGLAASPSLASQDLYHAYVLEVCAPFYLMPALLEWLLPLRAQSGALGPNAVLPIGVFESSVLKIRDRKRGIALHWRADLKPSEAHFSASALQESLQCLAEELQAQKAEAQETGVSAQQLAQLMSQARREQIVEALMRAQSLASQEEELDDELDDEVDDAIDDELEATSTPNDGLPQEAIPEPFGVPLRDLFASIKSKEVCKAERGLSIRVSSIITEWNLEVLPPDGLSLSYDGMAAWIKLEGRLPAALSPILCSLKTLSTLNTAAVGCGVTLCDDGTPRVFVTLPWYVDNNPWDAVQKPLLLSVLVAGADPMLALLTGRESPDTPSLWQAWEFQQASEMLESHNLGAFCTGGGAGFTATFQVEASGFNQAMLEVRSMSHPTVGGGVASRLRLPQTLSSESAYWRVANALNLAEVHSGLTAPHIGAWGVDRGALTYSSFLPNFLHDYGPSLLCNWGVYQLLRARWASPLVEQLCGEDA